MPGRMHYPLFVRKASRGSCAASRNARFALTWNKMLPWVPQQVPSTLNDTLMHGASVNFKEVALSNLDDAHPGCHQVSRCISVVSWDAPCILESTLVHGATGIHQYALNFTLTDGVSLLYLGIHVCHRDVPSVRAARMNALSARTAFRMQGASGCLQSERCIPVEI